MLRRSVVVGLMVVFVAVGLLAMVRQAAAEEPAPAGGGARPSRADRAAQAATRMKESLGASEEEWKALQPLIEKVQTLRREVRGGMFGGMAGRTGRGGRGGAAAPAAGAPAPAAAEQSETEKKAAELSKLLENKEAKAEDVKAALAALREARAKKQVELDAAQTALRAVLTVIQEAKLVSMGVLD